MLKLVFVAAFLAVASSAPAPDSNRFVGSAPQDSEIILNPFGLSVYAAPPQAPVLRTALPPKPYVSPIPYSPYSPFRTFPTPYAASPVQPTPIYVSPEQHAMYEAAIASLNPLSYAARQEAIKIFQAQQQLAQQNQ